MPVMKTASANKSDPAKELIKKRVLYIGSAVPLDTVDGLEGVQKPLLERYPIDDDNLEGIESILTVVNNGFTLQYVSDPSRKLFFHMSTLTFCAAVRCVTTVSNVTGKKTARFESISSTHASNAEKPAILSVTTRRTEGRKVLECHGFICQSTLDAMDLVKVISNVDCILKGKTSTGNYAATDFSRNKSQKISEKSNSLPLRVRSSDVASHSVRNIGDSQATTGPPVDNGYFYATRDCKIKKYSVEKSNDTEFEHGRRFSLSSGSLSLPCAPVNENRVASIPSRVPANMPLSLQWPRPQMISQPYLQQVGMKYPHFANLQYRNLPTHRNPVPMSRVFPANPFFRRSIPMRMVNYQYSNSLRMPGTVAPLIDYNYYPENHGMPPGLDYTGQRQESSAPSSEGPTRSSSPETLPRTSRRGYLNGKYAYNEDSSRPNTPPTDYDRKSHVSRREQFEYKRRNREFYKNRAMSEYSSSLNYPNYFLPSGHPHDVRVYNTAFPYAAHWSSPSLLREQMWSVPPPSEKGKAPKNSKSAKKNKDRHQTRKKSKDCPEIHRRFSSENKTSLDSEQDHVPREYRRFANQFTNEKEFSKSLAEGGVSSEHVNDNAYSLNKHMAQKASVPEADFHLY